MILVLLLWLLGAQDASWPELPAQLQEIPSIREAYENRVQGDDPELAAGAAAEILVGLQQADLAAQADFVLALLPRTDFRADLGPTLARIRKEWAPFSARIEEVLVAGMDGSAAELIPGALRAAELLALSGPTRVQAVAAYLRSPKHAVAARVALQEITRREFLNYGDFEAWWNDAQYQDREQWLASVNDRDRDEILMLWGERLASDPQSALEGISNSRASVRLLAIDAFAQFSPEFVAANLDEIRAALTAAVGAPSTPIFRARVVKQIPRFYDDGEATSLLNDYMLNPAESTVVRREAAEGIGRVQPKIDAFRAYVGAVRRLYMGQDRLPSEAGLRSAIFSGLWTLSRSDPEFVAQLEQPETVGTPNASGSEVGSGDAAVDHAGLDLLTAEPTAVLNNLRRSLEYAMGREKDPAVRAELFSAIAEYGTQAFISRLVTVAEDTSAVPDERYAAIDAAGALAKRTGSASELVEQFLGLLSDEDYGVRYSTAGALGSLEYAPATLKLTERLPRGEGYDGESDPRMFPRLLKQIGRARSDAALPILLEFVPDEELRSGYRQALVRQISGEQQYARAVLASRAVLDRGDAELSRRLVALATEGNAEGVPDELLQQRADLQATAEVIWLFGRPSLKPYPAEVAQCFEWLAEREEAQAQAASWPQFAGELHSRLAQNDQAFASWARALSKTPAGSDFDEAALRLLRFGEAKGLLDETIAVLRGIAELSTPQAQAELVTIRTRLVGEPATEAEDDEATAGQPDPEQPSSQASPPPAPAEDPEGGGDGDGDSDSSSITPEQADAPASAEPAGADPGQGGGDGESTTPLG